MWFGLRNRREREPGTRLVDDATELIAETEAFLSGDILSHLQHSGRAIPGWAWLNAFVHGDLSRIRQVRSSCAEESVASAGLQEEAWMLSDPVEDSWRAENLAREAWRSAERVLADELLELVEEDDELLCRVQALALVPLELQLLDSNSHEELSPFELVRSTRAALRSLL